MDMEILNLIVNILGVVLIPILVFIITSRYSDIESKQDKQRLVTDLYQKYHSVDFYGQIRVPLYKIRIKWYKNIGTQENIDYRKTVASGWGGSLGADEQAEMFEEDCYKGHHTDIRIFTGLTEHEILTLGLEFWATLNILRTRDLIDPEMLHIFKDKYAYDREFIASLRDEFKKDYPAVSNPHWIKDTEELEKFFYGEETV